MSPPLFPRLRSRGVRKMLAHCTRTSTYRSRHWAEAAGFLQLQPELFFKGRKQIGSSVGLAGFAWRRRREAPSHRTQRPRVRKLQSEIVRAGQTGLLHGPAGRQLKLEQVQQLLRRLHPECPAGDPIRGSLFLEGSRTTRRPLRLGLDRPAQKRRDSAPFERRGDPALKSKLRRGAASGFAGAVTATPSSPDQVGRGAGTDGAAAHALSLIGKFCWNVSAGQGMHPRTV